MSNRRDADPIESNSEPGRFEQLRQWALEHRRASVAALAGTLVLIAGATASALYFRSSADTTEQQVTLQMALDALDREQYGEARKLAEELRKRRNLPPESLGGPPFVLGAAMIAEADVSWAAEQTHSYLLASRLLEEARDRGFPPGRHATGLFLLGKSLFKSQQFARSRRWLRESLAEDDSRAKQVNVLLSNAYVNDSNPKWGPALEHNSQYLSMRMLTPEERNEALLQRSRILFGLQQFDACRETLSQIAPDAKSRAEGTLMRARLLMHEAEQASTAADGSQTSGGDANATAKEKYAEAIHALRAAQGQDTLGSQTTRKSLYLIGVCYANMSDDVAALDQLQRTRRLYPVEPEGKAANLLEAELHRKAGHHDKAVMSYKLALESAGDPLVYSNPWVSLDDFRRRVEDAYDTYLADEQFEHANALLDDFSPIFSEDRTVQLQAQTQSRWGEAILAKADKLSPTQAEQAEIEARQHFIKAGYTYSELARLHTTGREYPEDVWRGAESFLAGHDFPNAKQLLTIYLKNESRQRRPQALLAFGQASMALGEIDEGITALRECIEFHPRDVAVYAARIWCAKAHQEKGELLEAEELLQENLVGSGLTPASPEWRESLFELGQLLHADGRYKQAIEKLTEAVEREKLLAGGQQFPYERPVVLGLYTIAEAYSLSAREPRQRLLTSTIESDRQETRRQITGALEQAANYYAIVRSLINRRQETAPLAEWDQAILRNSYFSLGSALFDLGRYNEAIEAYSDAEARYQNDPLVLEIFVQVANCYRRMDRTVEARGALERAKVVLKRLPAEGAYLESTNYTRDEWTDLLDRLSKW